MLFHCLSKSDYWKYKNLVMLTTTTPIHTCIYTALFSVLFTHTHTHTQMNANRGSVYFSMQTEGGKN